MKKSEQTFSKIRQSYKDCAIALSLVQPCIDTPLDAKVTIDKTNLMNATKVIRDALLHRATLAVVRIFDVNTGSKNHSRIVFDRLFREMKEDSIPEQEIVLAQKLYLSIKESGDFVQLKSIRHGRIAHLLDDKGASNIYGLVCSIHNETRKLIESCESLLNLTPHDFHQFWNDTGRDFWKCIFAEGGKYAKSE